MILAVFFFFLCVVFAESLDQGESCSFTNGNPGVCTLINNCQSVKQQLINGNVPDPICGYSGLEPIVCCPPSKPANFTGDGRGAISRQKCAEYGQSVFVLKKIPLLVDNHEELKNVSQCAIASQPLIVGGPNALAGEFPHMAAIGFDLKNGDIDWLCSGTLISETFVLTAAHCTNSRELGEATWVRVGNLNLVRNNEGAVPENRRIIERIRHPDFKFPSLYHDIALLRLETRVPFNRWIRPACLHTAPSTEQPKAIVTGWGVEWNTYESANDLTKSMLSIVASKSCNASWTSEKANRKLPNGVVDNLLICASADWEKACRGDSGGPLSVFSEYYCMYDIVGITSLGHSCGSKLPGLYTRVYNYVPWIESLVWG